jgi:hypothetical protein
MAEKGKLSGVPALSLTIRANGLSCVPEISDVRCDSEVRLALSVEVMRILHLALCDLE